MKLSPELQAEYDALGLPWSCVPDIASVAEKDWYLFERFELDAINRHFQLEQAVETLRGALIESNQMWRELTGSELPIAKTALKETEGLC